MLQVMEGGRRVLWLSWGRKSQSSQKDIKSWRTSRVSEDQLLLLLVGFSESVSLPPYNVDHFLKVG